MADHDDTSFEHGHAMRQRIRDEAVKAAELSEPVDDYVALSDTIRRAPSRFDKRFAIGAMGEAIDDLREQLAAASGRAETAEARLAEIGTEWGVRFPDNQVEICDSENDAREWAGQNWPSGGGLTVMCRDASKWREAEPAKATGGLVSGVVCLQPGPPPFLKLPRAEAADATADGRSGPVTRQEASGGERDELEFEKPAAGQTEADGE